MPCKLNVQIEDLVENTDLSVEELEEITELIVQEQLEQIVLVVEDNPCSGGGDVQISSFPNNQLQRKTDGLFVGPAVWNNNEW